MSRVHPLLGPEALPDVAIPVTPPHEMRRFRLPSCIERPARARLRTEPTRTSKWFADGDALAGAEVEAPEEMEESDEARLHPLAWWLSMAIVVLAGAALICVICWKAAG